MTRITRELLFCASLLILIGSVLSTVPPATKYQIANAGVVK